MCGRYLFTVDGSPEILQIAQEVEQRYGVGAWMPGEIKPTMTAPILVAADGNVHPELYDWGYRLPSSLVINARAETAADKPLFRDSIASKRCVIPSSGFFEWDGEKRKYLFTLPGENTLYMAGLYAVRDGKTCYCILTTAANPSIRAVHHRMPLVLTRDQVRPWLEQSESAADFLAITPPLLERVSAEEQLSMW